MTCVIGKHGTTALGTATMTFDERDTVVVIRDVLAEVYAELGDFERSWTIAQSAQEAAQRAGNQLDLAEATLILGKLYASRGDIEQAERLLDDAATRFERLGHADRAAELRRQLNVLMKQVRL